MTYSEIEITFDRNFALENKITLLSYINSIPFENSFYWKNLRSIPFQVTTGTPTLTEGERTAMNFVDAFNLDLNNAGQYVVTRTSNVVTIKSNNQNEIFT
ncbi:MAG: hypothetical protein K2P85_04035, partial [Flavobacteriaceae bacterium]|nr:hypothetical protein [Flavobacteriaceae bacterium]